MCNSRFFARLAVCSFLLSGGLANAQMSFPISMSQGADPIAGIGYMQTSITITSSGQLSATTHTWSAKDLEGFHGSVAVAALDQNQVLLWVSATQTYGVDQKICPPFSTCHSDRTDTWSDTIPTQLLSRAAFIAIKHRYTPKGVTLDDIGNWLRGLGNDVARELGPILQALGLRPSGPPPQQTPLACGPSPSGPSANHPFTVVTLGDSIMWGQGLPDGQKFRDRVTAWLQSQFGGSRQVIQIATRSHSGAILEVAPTSADKEAGLTGEIPNSYPTISKQMELTVAELQQTYHVSPSDVNLLLIDGGINNVNVLEILKPNHSTGTIEAFTNAAMDKMQSLLQDAMRCFPSAGIVVTGYYPIVSSSSDLGALTALFAEFGAQLGAGGGVLGTVVGVAGGAGVAALSKDQMVRNSAAFADTAHSRLLQMVSQLNPPPPASPRLALAWPNFQSDNSYGAPNSFLWTVTDFVGPEADGVIGRDPPPAGTPNRVAWNRARDCWNLGQGANPECLDASMGHPNIAGAETYTDAIITKLQAVFAAKLGLPQQKTLFAHFNSGTDANGPFVYIKNRSNEPPQVNNYWTQVSTWFQVNAADASNKPVQASVSVTPIPPPYWPFQQSVEAFDFGVLPNGYDSGVATLPNGYYTQPGEPTGRKIYYMCLPAGTPINGPAPRPANVRSFPGNQQGCWVQLSAPGYVSCVLQLGSAPASGGPFGGLFGAGANATRPAELCPAAPMIAGNIATVQNNTIAGRTNPGTTGLQVQLPALAATVCTSSDGRSCTSGIVAPQSAPWDIVSVTSSGAPVAGATLMAGQQSLPATNASGIAVINRLCYSPNSQVPKIGQTTFAGRIPLPCAQRTAIASMSGYQAVQITLP
jgi:hypothetical protein